MTVYKRSVAILLFFVVPLLQGCAYDQTHNDGASQALLPVLETKNILVLSDGTKEFFRPSATRDVKADFVNTGEGEILLYVKHEGGRRSIPLKPGDAFRDGLKGVEKISARCSTDCALKYHLTYAPASEPSLGIESLQWISSKTCFPSDDCGADGNPCYRSLAEGETTVLHGSGAAPHAPSDISVTRCTSGADPFCNNGGAGNAVTVFVDQGDENLFTETLSSGAAFSSSTGVVSCGEHTRLSVRCNQQNESCHIVWQVCHQPGAWIKFPGSTSTGCAKLDEDE